MMQDTETSVIVSWDSVDFAGVDVEGYTVYYYRVSSRKSQADGSMMSMNVSSTENSVKITDLVTEQQYQFLVVVRVTFRGVSVTGKISTSTVITVQLLTRPDVTSRGK